MSASGKTIGFVLIGVGLAIGVAIAAWLIAGYAEDNTRASGAIFGGILGLFFLVLPLTGAGFVVLSKGKAEQKQLDEVRSQRALLDMVKTRGQIQISDIVIELGSTRDKVQQDLHQLVGRGLFTGYVDWDKGELYSIEASKLNGQQSCPSCGGQLELAGKGLIKCPYCGTEIFL